MESVVLRQLLRFVRPAWALPALVALGILGSLTEGLGISLLIPLLGEVLHGAGAGAATGPFVGLVQRYADVLDRDARIALVAATIIGLIAFKSAVLYAHAALSAWLRGRVVDGLRRALFRQLLQVGYAFVARNEPGRLMDTLDAETWRTADAMTLLFSLVSSTCMVAVFAGLLVLISWPLTLAAAAAVVLASLVVRLVARRARRLGDDVVEASSVLSERSVEALGAMRMIRAFGQEAREQARFDRAADGVRGALLRLDLLSGVVQPLMELLYGPLFLGALMLAWYAGVGLPALLAFLLLLYRLQPQVKNLDQCRVALAGLAGAVANVATLLDRGDKPYIRSGAVPFERLKEGIAFRKVSFGYGRAADERPALDRVSLEVRSLEVTALVGGSGAGKTTLINLLLRLYDPVEGEILVDGRPLRDLDLATWRARLAIAGQDADLMGGTILENIAYGRPDADRAAIVAAARRADAHDFIESLPDGYETAVGERGLRLSGGQRQRIGLARAFLRDPEILILDEATNAVDALAEQAIQDTLKQMAGRLTIIVIAHRFSTIRNADRVVMLDGGRVVEEGPPRELFRASGPFARLYEPQVSVSPD